MAGNLSVKKWVIQKVGGFDPRFPFALEDVEFSQRIQKEGLSLYYFPLEVIHHTRPNLISFVRWSWSKGRGGKIYLNLLADEQNWKKVGSFWESYRFFKHFCNSLEADYPWFNFDRRILPVALLFYIVEHLALRIPLLRFTK